MAWSSNESFDHRKHCKSLEEAEKELRALGRDDLAGSVSRARLIHVDLEGRIAQARQVEDSMRRVMDRLNDAIETSKRYVSNPKAPWIGYDLFPYEEDK